MESLFIVLTKKKIKQALKRQAAHSGEDRLRVLTEHGLTLSMRYMAELSYAPGGRWLIVISSGDSRRVLVVHDVGRDFVLYEAAPREEPTRILEFGMKRLAIERTLQLGLLQNVLQVLETAQ
jgi:hypothetical protein